MPNRIKELREAKDLLQKDLAELINVSINTIRRWESGEREPRGRDLLSLASFFETTPEYLMGQSDVFIHTPSSRLRAEAKMIYAPVVLREWMACCGEGISFSDITSKSEKLIPWDRGDFKAYDELRPPFAIYVEGDSLESANIHDGDEVIINPADVPAQGSIALVSYHNTYSLKYVYKLRNGDILLQCDAGEIQLSTEEQKDCGFEICGSAIASCHRLRSKPLMRHEVRK